MPNQNIGMISVSALTTVCLNKKLFFLNLFLKLNSMFLFSFSLNLRNRNTISEGMHFCKWMKVCVRNARKYWWTNSETYSWNFWDINTSQMIFFTDSFRINENFHIYFPQFHILIFCSAYIFYRCINGIWHGISKCCIQTLC